jgi:hypothetical protein
VALAVNLLLPVQWQVILILADDHLRQQGRARQALLNQPGRQRRDDDPFDVRILGSDVQALDELRRFPVQFLGHFLPQLAPAFGLLLHFLGFEHHPFRFQMRGQWLAHGFGDDRGTGWFWLLRHGCRSHHPCQTRQQQFQLFGIQTLVLGAAEVTLEEEFQLLPEQFVFDLRRRQRALQGRHQLLQRAEFVGKRGVHRSLQTQTRAPPKSSNFAALFLR